MKISKISMAILAATAVMAISPAAVRAQADTNAPAGQPPRGGGRGQMITIEQIDKAVTLTDAEKPKVKVELEAYTKAMTEARAADQSERRTKTTAAREAFSKKMKEILTADQYKKFEAMPAMQPRGPGGRGGGGAGGAGGGAPPAQ
jgi:Spy/CpxP family protein refolding chaperone